MKDFIKPEPKEPDYAYQAFLVYLREQPPRPSMEALGERLSQVFPERKWGIRTIYRLRNRFEWDRRVLEYDRDMVEVEFTARRKIRASAAATSEYDELRARMLMTAQLMHKVGVKLLGKANKAIDALEEGDAPPSNLSTAVRTGGHILQSSLEAEAQVLGLEEFMEHFEKVTERDTAHDLELDP